MRKESKLAGHHKRGGRAIEKVCRDCSAATGLRALI